MNLKDAIQKYAERCIAIGEPVEFTDAVVATVFDEGGGCAD